MLRLSKKADYGLMAMKHLAEVPAGIACSTKEVADRYSIPQEALAKILQRLARAGLLHSRHGINGGYILARPASAISAFEVIQAIDGPWLLTSCVTTRGACDQTRLCNVREPLRKVNDSIEEVLRQISIAALSEDSDGAHSERSGQRLGELVVLA